MSNDTIEINKTGWRVEIIQRGRFYQWRRGSRDKRQCAYGGKFRDLDPDRKAAYKARRKHDPRDET